MISPWFVAALSVGSALIAVGIRRVGFCALVRSASFPRNALLSKRSIRKYCAWRNIGLPNESW